MELLRTKEPHYIPGYTGYCPQYIYRISDTYGTPTHKILIDPCKSHVESFIVSSRANDEYRIERPTLREVDLVKAHEKAEDPIYKFPTTPGYEGFIPFINNIIGARFAITATEGITRSEQRAIKEKCEARTLKHRSAVVDTNIFHRSLGERTLEGDNYRLPLLAVRPDSLEVIAKDDEEIPPAPPLPYSQPSSKIQDSQNLLIPGFAGSSPFTWPRFGQGDKPLKSSALCDFANDYHHRLSAEWPPITNAGIGSTKPTNENYEIYVKTCGIIPSYAGHVPGYKYCTGKTYGKCTIDAKSFFRK